MSRGPRPLVTIRDAIPIALQRGAIQLAERGTELLYDFMISGTKPKPVAFVSVKYTERIRATLEDISRDCDDRIRQLRSIARDATVSCELWLHSRYGTWRFFRVTADALVELGNDGGPLAAAGRAGREYAV